MSTARILGQSALTGVVVLNSMMITMTMAQAQPCFQVRGPKQARVLSKNCSSDTETPATRDDQQTPIVKKQTQPESDALTPEQSINREEAIGGGSIEEQAPPKIQIRGPKRGGYIGE